MSEKITPTEEEKKDFQESQDETVEKENDEILKTENTSEEKTEEVDEKNISSPTSKKTIWKVILGIVVLITIIISLILGVFYHKVRTFVDSYENKVYPQMYVEDIDLSGLSKDELENRLTELLNSISGKKFIITVSNQQFEISYRDINVDADISSLCSEIYQYGKDETLFSKYNLLQNPVEKNYSIELIFDEEALNSFIQEAAESVRIEPENASISISSGNVNITESINGQKLIEDDLFKQIKSNINTDLDVTEYAIDGKTEEIAPEIATSELESVNGIIGSYTTYFSAGPSGNNIAVGAEYVNNTLLMPGDVFSCEAAIGPTTVERGFGYANTYVAGKVVPGLGGGVCQIASTIYNAELRSGIIPTERLNHMMPVGYVGIGLDATLADNLIDLKFENPYDYPIVIHTSTTSGSLTVEFWSNTNATGGVTYEPYTIKEGSLYAETYLKGYDKDGNVVFDEYIDSSKYDPPSW